MSPRMLVYAQTLWAELRWGEVPPHSGATVESQWNTDLPKFDPVISKAMADDLTASDIGPLLKFQYKFGPWNNNAD